MSEEPKQDNDPKPTDEDRAPIDFAGVVREMMILTCGLLLGFIWTMANEHAVGKGVDFNIYNLMIGLFILICILVRYLYLAKFQDKITREDIIVKQFIIEIAVLIPAIMGGYFWYTFYAVDGRIEVHLVILMVVLIFGLARVVYKISQNQQN